MRKATPHRSTDSIVHDLHCELETRPYHIAFLGATVGLFVVWDCFLTRMPDEPATAGGKEGERRLERVAPKR